MGVQQVQAKGAALAAVLDGSVTWGNPDGVVTAGPDVS